MGECFSLDDGQGPLDLALYRSKKIGSRLKEKPRETGRQPVVEVGIVDADEVDERFNEHAEDFNLRVVEHLCEDLRHLPKICNAA